MLPDIDGFEVCKKVSQLHPEISIIMLTARGADMDKINGLELGADDYIIKPFNPMEVIARIRAIIRRTNKTDSSNAIEIDPFKIDFNTQKFIKRTRSGVNTYGILLDEGICKQYKQVINQG